MTALEVSLNGKRLCTAGLKNGVVTTIVHWVNTTGANRQSAKATIPKESLSVQVGGLDTILLEEMRWRDRKLRMGDTVTIHVVDALRVDQPQEREARDPRKDLTAKQTYVRRIAKELGWTIEENAAPSKRAAKKRAA